MLIRPATIDDIPALAELAALTFPLATPSHTTPESIQTFIDQVLSPSMFEAYLSDQRIDLIVAEDDDALVGYVMLKGGEPYDPDVAKAVTIRPTVELSKCYVHPDAHGSGLAQQLVIASLEAAEARGGAVLWLGVNQENDRAQRFYDKAGFERVGEKRFQVGDGLEHDYVYQRRLRLRVRKPGRGER